MTSPTIIVLCQKIKKVLGEVVSIDVRFIEFKYKDINELKRISLAFEHEKSLFQNTGFPEQNHFAEIQQARHYEIKQTRQGPGGIPLLGNDQFPGLIYH